jgi:hypothetical protein
VRRRVRRPAPRRVRRNDRIAATSANALAVVACLATLVALSAVGPTAASAATAPAVCKPVDAAHGGRWAPGEFPKSVLGDRYEGFPEERWLDIAHFHEFAPIMERRIAMCARKGFDGVEPDNVAGWENRTGFALTRADQRRYNLWIARQVHRRGMAVALKNDPRQARELLDAFDFAVVEECFQYHECGFFKPFVEAGKPVFAAEYELPPAKFCAAAQALGFSAIRKGLELFAKPWQPCDPRPSG